MFAWTGDDDYHLFGGYDEDELVAVAGVVLTNVLHHVRHAWLYDLVVDEPHRGEGYGTELVRFVEAWAADRDCERMALASPREKEATHRFYEALDYERWGYVVERALSTGSLVRLRPTVYIRSRTQSRRCADRHPPTGSGCATRRRRGAECRLFAIPPPENYIYSPR